MTEKQKGFIEGLLRGLFALPGPIVTTTDPTLAPGGELLGAVVRVIARAMESSARAATPRPSSIPTIAARSPSVPSEPGANLPDVHVNGEGVVPVGAGNDR